MPAAEGGRPSSTPTRRRPGGAALEDWDTNPWVLTEQGRRWYGRGAADCRSNVVAVLTALRAVRDVVGRWPRDRRRRRGLRGAEHRRHGALACKRPELLRPTSSCSPTLAYRLGQPTLTTTLRGTGSVRVTVDTDVGARPLGDVRRGRARRCRRWSPHWRPSAGPTGRRPSTDWPRPARGRVRHTLGAVRARRPPGRRGSPPCRAGRGCAGGDRRPPVGAARGDRSRHRCSAGRPAQRGDPGRARAVVNLRVPPAWIPLRHSGC